MKKKIGIIGSRGFIGRHFYQLYSAMPGCEVISVDTRKGWSPRGDASPFDLLYFCAGNACVYLSNQNPMRCLQSSVMDLIHYVTSVQHRKFVFLSSSLVYPLDLSDKSEDQVVDPQALTTYGANKLLAEFYVRRYATSYLILRPTGFFGSGLRKNLLFDLKSQARRYYVSLDSYLDWMGVERFCSVVEKLAQEFTNETFNIGSGYPFSVKTLLEWAPPGFEIVEPRRVDDRTINLNRLHRYTKLYPSAAVLKKEIAEFLQC